MELHSHSSKILQKIDEEILAVSKKISTAIRSENFTYIEIDEWILLLNNLIRHLDHTVEELLTLKNKYQTTD